MAQAQLKAYSLSGVQLINFRSAYDDPNNFGYAVTDPEALLDPGALTWRRQTAESPWIHGNFEFHAVMEQSQATMRVLVMHSDHEEIRDMMFTLIDRLAENRSEWLLRLTLDAAIYEWHCYRPDFAVQMNRKFWHAKAPEINLSFPRRPVAVSGPI